MVVFVRTVEKSIILGIIFTILYNFVNFSVNCENINNKVLRLHILANSNSVIDQNVKMKVKNEIQNFTHKILFNVKNKKEAIEICNKNLGNMREIAVRELSKSNRINKKIEIKLEKTFFRTRNYNNITMPAGFYDAIKIKIGSGKGKNWWCVIFPVLCLGIAQTNTIIKTFNKNENKISSNKNPTFKFKFKIVELYENFKKWLRNIFCTN